MDFEYRTPFFICFRRNEITNVWSDTGRVDYSTATAALLIATRENVASVVYKGFEDDPNLYRENFNDRYRPLMRG